MREAFYLLADTVVKIVGERTVIDKCFDAFETDDPGEGADYIEWIVKEDVPPSQTEEERNTVFRFETGTYEVCVFEDSVTVRHPENIENRVSMIKFEENMQKATFYIPHYGDEHDWEFSREARSSFADASLDAFCLAMHKRGGILVKGASIDSEKRGVLLASLDYDAVTCQAQIWNERYGAVTVSDRVTMCRVSKDGLFVYPLPWTKEASGTRTQLAGAVFIGGHNEGEVSFLPKEETKRRLVGLSFTPEWLDDESVEGAALPGNMRPGREREIIAKKISEILDVSVLIGDGAENEVIDIVRNML
ncbi:MAG: hypothetical protein ILP10_08780 [Lachnospiraceae bacterium]|nr:hypothetical protein [Lachnospiraceae bacterium]